METKIKLETQQVQKYKEHWTYYFIDTSSIYIKTITNTAKSGSTYNSYYFYWADKYGNEILKFSTPTWNCFSIWDGENRYMLLRVDKNDTNERTIKMVQQLESVRASECVQPFNADDVFDSLVLDECGNDDNDCEDYDE